ncbi:MAG: hypothetical protein ACK4E2_06800, partial [Pseudothermotoga sp.]
DANEKMSKGTGIEYSMFPYNPESLNRKLKYVGGKKSGRAFIKLYLQKKGLKASDVQVEEILMRVKRQSIVMKNYLDEEELDKIVKIVLG